MTTNHRLNILNTVLMILLADHPEFEEQNSTGNDLILGIQYMIDELSNSTVSDLVGLEDCY